MLVAAASFTMSFNTTFTDKVLLPLDGIEMPLVMVNLPAPLTGTKEAISTVGLATSYSLKEAILESRTGKWWCRNLVDEVQLSDAGAVISQ
jgi:hypothetical protein